MLQVRKDPNNNVKWLPFLEECFDSSILVMQRFHQENLILEILSFYRATEGLSWNAICKHFYTDLIPNAIWSVSSQLLAA